MKLAAYYSRLTHYSAPVDGLGGSSTGTYIICVYAFGLSDMDRPTTAVSCRAVPYSILLLIIALCQRGFHCQLTSIVAYPPSIWIVCPLP